MCDTPPHACEVVGIAAPRGGGGGGGGGGEEEELVGQLVYDQSPLRPTRHITRCRSRYVDDIHEHFAALTQTLLDIWAHPSI